RSREKWRASRLSAQSSETSDGLELFQRAPARGRGGDREQIADIEQDLQHQLVPHVGALEIDHASGVLGCLGAVVRFAVDRLEIGEDAFTRAHAVESGMREGVRQRSPIVMRQLRRGYRDLWFAIRGS